MSHRWCGKLLSKVVILYYSHNFTMGNIYIYIYIYTILLWGIYIYVYIYIYTYFMYTGCFILNNALRFLENYGTEKCYKSCMVQRET